MKRDTSTVDRIKGKYKIHEAIGLADHGTHTIYLLISSDSPKQELQVRYGYLYLARTEEGKRLPYIIKQVRFIPQFYKLRFTD